MRSRREKRKNWAELEGATRALEQIRTTLAKRKIDALLVSQPANVRYLSGFRSPSDGRVVVAARGAALFTDFRYDVQAGEESLIPYIIWRGDERLGYVKRFLKKREVKVLGIESEAVTVGELNRLRSTLEVRVRQTTGLVSSMRKTKRAFEIEKIRKAAAINDEAFEHMLGVIKPGLTEVDVTLELEWFLRKHADFQIAFSIIAASGPNGAKPHAQPGRRKIRKGDLVTLDYGSIWDGYCSDITRTVAVGQPSRKMRSIYETVLEAQQEGLAAIGPGSAASKADSAARRVIRAAGYGKYFGHGLGHGVGLQVHEAPRLSQHSTDTLAPGMVVTCEPGIYVPQLGGVRIEDLVLVTEGGSERLSLATKELICL